MKGMMKMKNKLDYNIRQGRAFNFTEVLDSLELTYRANLKADIDSFDAWEDVQAETYNDEIVTRNILETYAKCGYLEDEELSSMIEYAKNIRLEMLEILEKEGEKNGKEV